MAKKTNILLITSDQQHWNTLGVLNPEIKTPNLDRLAKEGTLYTRAYCPNPTCTPTRASIITGQYPSQHGAYSLGTKLMEDRHTVGEDFMEAGYRTALVGKAHFQPLKSTEEYPSLEAYPILQDLEFWKNYDETFYGFDHVELARNHTDEAHVGQHYALWLEEKGCENWRDYFRTPTGKVEHQKHKWLIPEEFHYNTWIAERSNAMLDEFAAKDEPFFLWASFFDPHPDYLVPEPWDTMYDPEKITVPEIFEGEHDVNPPHFQKTQEEKPDFSYLKEEGGNGCHGCHSHLHDKKELAKDIAIYYGMVSCMDKYIGKIVDRLDELGMKENTLIVFSTDHGHFFGQHGLVRKGPFHYEDMVKIPFIVRQPGTVPAGKQSDAMQSLVDLAPSFLKHCGIEVPNEMTGVDQTPVWKGEEEEARDHVLVENRHQPTTINHKTYIGKRYKITVYYGQDYGEVFDLHEDPCEVKNLWSSPEHQELKKDLLLKFMHAEMGKEPIPMPRISGA
ncbi:MAG: sulfatase-like hydrolase/transferase [Planctomycetes bacterium]|nr:sulfatase-like hydrolase/transferase [Planctomycetota bacterium]